MKRNNCTNCNRIIPNKTHLIENGCKWCIGITEVWDEEWGELLEGVTDNYYLTSAEFISKVYYWLSYQRGFPGWKTNFVNKIKELVKRGEE